MELRSVSGQVNVAQIASIRQNSGRITLPVSRAQTPYAQFKYVKGVPSTGSTGSVPIHRLRTLNTMINGLVKKASSPQILPEKENKMSNESIKALIDQYSSQLHSALKSSTAAYVPAASGYTGGAVLNVLV